MQINIIAAVSKNMAIGNENKLLYWLPNDLKRFKALTTGHTIVMGRKTFESIGRALPKRVNIVVSRGFNTGEEVAVAASLEDAFKVAEETNLEQCFVIGGGQIYSQALPLVDSLIVTHVHTVIEDADTFFPEIKEEEWELVSAEKHAKDEKNPYDYTFAEYIRKN